MTIDHLSSFERGDFVVAGELSGGKRLPTLAGTTAVLDLMPICLGLAATINPPKSEG